MKKPVNRNVDPNLPVFGIDVAETEALRLLETTAWHFVQEEASEGDLIRALNHVRAVRRGRKQN
jgi:hypothetical protein